MYRDLPYEAEREELIRALNERLRELDQKVDSIQRVTGTAPIGPAQEQPSPGVPPTESQEPSRELPYPTVPSRPISRTDGRSPYNRSRYPGLGQADRRPPQPTNLEASVQYHSGGVGQNLARIQIDYQLAPGASVVTAYMNEDQDNYRTAKLEGNFVAGQPIVVWVEQPKQDEPSKTYWFYVTASSAAAWGYPTGRTAKLSVTVSPASAPVNLSSFTVTTPVVKTSPVPTGTFRFSFTKPSDGKLFLYHVYRRWYTDATFSTPATGWEYLGNVGASAPPGAVTEDFGEWPFPASPEYLGFQLRAVARTVDSDGVNLEQQAGIPEAFITVPASDGLDLTAVDGATIGPGLTKDPSGGKLKLATADLSNMVMNPGFEDGLEHWRQEAGSVTADSTKVYTGTKSARLVGSGGDAELSSASIGPIRPGDQIYVESYVYLVSGSMIRLFGYWLDANGAAISALPVAFTNTTGSWGKLSLVGTAPASTSGMQLRFDLGDQAGEAHVDNVVARRVIDSQSLLSDSVVGQNKIAADALSNGLELQGGKLQVRISSGLKFNGNLLEADYDGTEVTIDANGRLTVGGVPAPDITSGQFIVGVTIAAAQVLAGLFQGHELELTKNNVKTEIRNLWDGNAYSGLRVSSTLTGEKALVQPSYMSVEYPSYGRVSWIQCDSGKATVAAQYSGTSEVLLVADSSGGIVSINSLQVLKSRITGWGTISGTTTRGGFDTGTVTLQELAWRLGQLIVDLKTHGLIGA